MKLRFEAPTADTPGFLRRTRSAMAFSEKINAGSLSPDLVDEMVDFLAQFITEPEDKEQAKEALLDASQAQFTDMLNAVMGGGADAVPLPSAAT